MPLALIAALLRAVASIAARPDLGLDRDVHDILNLSAGLVDIGHSAEAELRALVAKVEQLVAENRGFTDDERAALRAESRRLSARLAELAAQRGDD